jgi:hypothetical protein
MTEYQDMDKPMISRRDFFRLVGSAAGSLAIARSARSDGPFEFPQPYAVEKPRVFSGTKPGITFNKYLDPLPIIHMMPNAGVANQYQIAMKQFTQKIHRDLPPTTLWGFGAVGYQPSVPGGTIEARTNMPIRVRWINDLPQTHLLAAAIDHTIHGAE